MSWSQNRASPEERPLHYLGRRRVGECMTLEHLAKLIKRLDPQLGDAIATGTEALSDGAMTELTNIGVHIWSSNTFTVVFSVSGHMGCSKRNAIDGSELNRGITIATARAVSAMLIEQRDEYEDMQEGTPPSYNLDQIVPLPRRFAPGAEDRAVALGALGQALMEEMEEDEAFPGSGSQASESLGRREERNINFHDSERSGRFRY